MTEYFKAFVVPLVVQVLVGLGAASLAIAAFNARLVAVFFPSAMPDADLSRFRELIDAGEGMAGKM